ncbi:unnamed protein product, partial [Mesorhabditis spiculigera]
MYLSILLFAILPIEVVNAVHVFGINVVKEEERSLQELQDGDLLTAYLVADKTSVKVYASEYDTCNYDRRNVHLSARHRHRDNVSNILLLYGQLKVWEPPEGPVQLCADTRDSIPGENWVTVNYNSWTILIWIAVALGSSMLSALCTGLNIGLMSLSIDVLEAMKNHGRGRIVLYTESIIPLRRNGNLLMCSIIIVNMLNALAFNHVFESLDLPDVQRIIYTVLCPTATTLIIGEILPQVICAKHALFVGYYTRHVTHALLLVTYPLAGPCAFILTIIAGAEPKEAYDRGILAGLLEEQRKGEDEGNWILTLMINTLKNMEKTAADVMVSWDKVKKLSAHEKLDDALWEKISQMKYSRFPVMDGEQVIAMQYTKDLMAVKSKDFDGLTLESVACLWHKSRLFRVVLHDTPILPLLEEMRKGMPVMLVIQFVQGKMTIVGLMTLEDILEEVMGEIRDEKEKEKGALPRIWQHHLTAPKNLSETAGTRLNYTIFKRSSPILRGHVENIAISSRDTKASIRNGDQVVVWCADGYLCLGNEELNVSPTPQLLKLTTAENRCFVSADSSVRLADCHGNSFPGFQFRQPKKPNEGRYARMGLYQGINTLVSRGKYVLDSDKKRFYGIKMGTGAAVEVLPKWQIMSVIMVKFDLKFPLGYRFAEVIDLTHKFMIDGGVMYYEGRSRALDVYLLGQRLKITERDALPALPCQGFRLQSTITDLR